LLDFVVKAAFRVRRRRVLSLLSLALGEGSCYRIVGSLGPHGFDSCAPQNQALEGALNNGTVLLNKAGTTETHCLDRADIDRGLERFASQYPTYFADFLNDNENRMIARIFLQCCQDQK